MQSLSWYFHRLRTMSPGEVLWRVRSMVRDAVDVPRFAAGLYRRVSPPEDQASFITFKPGFNLDDVDARSWTADHSRPDVAKWVSDLCAKADQVVENKLTYFNLRDQFLGDPINWHKDHNCGRVAPNIPSALIDYRDFAKVGDCKHVWEPNRHHQFVVLARAFSVTRDKRYLDALCDQFDSWLVHNRPGYGMNWRSPLELGIRLINWVWALAIIRDRGALPNSLWRKIYRTAYLLCWDTSRKFSRGSSSNNHLIGEAAGVFVASHFFSDFPNAKRWQEESRRILEREIIAQSYEDGCSKEHALGYQLFVIQFFTVCSVVAERCGRPMSDNYHVRLAALCRFVGYLSDGSADLPFFGDRDDGYVLDLGGFVDDPDTTLTIGTCLLDDSELRDRVREWSEAPSWLFSHDRISQQRTQAPTPNSIELESRAFRDSGYVLLQSGERDTKEAISVLFDCAPLGMEPMAAHGHADALSLTLSVGGLPFIVDPGTYDYFSYPEWRQYFRSTAAHNSIEVNGASQSEPAGPFLWKRQARTTLIDFQRTQDIATASGSHDGYVVNDMGVMVKRAISLDASAHQLTISDEITSRTSSRLRLSFHLAPTMDVSRQKANEFSLCQADASCRLLLDPLLDANIVTSDADGFLGWVSPAYHCRTQSRTIVATSEVRNEMRLTHTIEFS